MSRAARVLLIEADAAGSGSACSTLRETGRDSLEVECVPSVADGIALLSSGMFDVILLDLPEGPGLAPFLDLRDSTGGLPVVLLGRQDDEEFALKAIREGAHDYLVKGKVRPESIARSIRYAAEKQRGGRQKRSTRQAGGSALAFLGAKGGTGNTTVALNTAAILSQKGKRTAALELRSFHGSFAAQLAGRDRNGFAHPNLATLLAMAPEAIGEAEVARCLHRHPCGALVLPGPQRPEEYGELSRAHAQAIVRAALETADQVVLDLPPFPSEANRAAVEVCRNVVVVTEWEESSLDAARAVVELLRFWNVDSEAIGALVVNRSPLGTNTSVAEIGTRLGCPVWGVMPPAADACADALRVGMPLAVHRPQAMAATSLFEAVRKIGAAPGNGFRVTARDERPAGRILSAAGWAARSGDARDR